MQHVDVYIFPCYSCGDPAGQVSGTVSNLANNGVTNNPGGGAGTFGMLWFDIEGPSYWSGDADSNVNFLAA
jgi:hypothetical protein